MQARSLLLAAVCAALAAGAIAWAMRPSPTPAGMPAPGAVERTAFDVRATPDIDAGTEATGPRPRPAAASAGWSPPATGFDPALVDTPAVHADMPAAEMLELLGPRARGGDVVAACELARVLKDCWMVRRPTPPPPPPAQGPAMDRYIEIQAAHQERMDRIRRRCEGVATGAASEAVLFAARAAVGGHAHSVVEFMQAPMVHAGEFIRTPALADAYRLHMWPLLQRAFAARNGEIAEVALAQLSMQSGIGDALASVVPPELADPGVARALMLMMAQEHRLPPNSSEPSERETEVARRLVDTLFGGELPSPDHAAQMAQRLERAAGGSNCRDREAWLQ